MNSASEKPGSILIENCRVISPDYKVGEIEGGYFADIVMLGDAFRPTAVWVNGELRWGTAKGDAGR